MAAAELVLSSEEIDEIGAVGDQPACAHRVALFVDHGQAVLRVGKAHQGVARLQLHVHLGGADAPLEVAA